MEFASFMPAGHVYQSSHQSHFPSVKGLSIMTPGYGVISDLVLGTGPRVSSTCNQTASAAAQRTGAGYNCKKEEEAGLENMPGHTENSDRSCLRHKAWIGRGTGAS